MDDIGNDGNTGSLTFGLDAALRADSGHAFAAVDYMHHLVRNEDLEFNALLHAHAGLINTGTGWQGEAAAQAAFELRW